MAHQLRLVQRCGSAHEDLSGHLVRGRVRGRVRVRLRVRVRVRGLGRPRAVLCEEDEWRRLQPPTALRAGQRYEAAAAAATAGRIAAGALPLPLLPLLPLLLPLPRGVGLASSHLAER